MATKKTPADLDDLDIEEGDFSLMETEGGRKVTKLSEKLQLAFDDDEVDISVYRKDKRGRGNSFLFEVDEYDNLPELQAKLRDEYGGGVFSIEGRRQNGSWAFKDTLKVEAPVSTAEKGAPHNDNFQSVLLAMQQASEKSSREARELMQQNMQMMIESQNQNMQMMLGIMSAKSNAPAESMGVQEVIGMFTALSALSKPEKTEDSMTLFLKGLEFGKELGGGGEENILQSAIKTFGAPLAAMATHQAERQYVPPYSPAAPYEAPQAAYQLQQHAPQSQDDLDMLELLKLKPEFDALIVAATNNDDVEESVVRALNVIPRELLIKYIVEPSRYETLYTFAPSLVKLRPWVDNFRARVIDSLQNGYTAPVNEEAVHNAPVKTDIFGGVTRNHVHGEPVELVTAVAGAAYLSDGGGEYATGD